MPLIGHSAGSVGAAGAAGSERGQSTVEFALVLPLVFVLLLGLLQVGVVLRDQLLVTAAAREGAREAAVTSNSEKIRTAARRAAPSLVLEVSVTRGPNRGDAVTVVITSKPNGLPIVGRVVASTRLEARATMRVERSKESGP